MTPQTSTLKVPGASLYYEMRGSGPVLLIIPGGPQDAGVFADVAGHLADRYTVVAYDPRGSSRSTFDGEPQEQDLDVHGDDAARLIEALGAGRPMCSAPAAAPRSGSTSPPAIPAGFVRWSRMSRPA
ncbi:alpha/beta fold hydrolase [Mesorhizobium sp. M0871]|uniref:alpha/beta fold hydrolase n=1 Tax=unclassified Mesorhizobium TaxID=325217 RepID=UPI00040F66F6|nr:MULTISPECIES: alpha/beta fold hydrolase [unclassified Mesorhizobium]WJI58040.1 alpha/beta fold hydrolase [Mesorhizobium sp. C432A]